MDKKNKTTIKLNGQQYNAISGTAIGNGSIDGVINSHRPQQNHTLIFNNSLAAKKQPPRQSSKHIELKPDHARTLMRSAVNKPKNLRSVKKVSAPLTVQKSSAILSSPMVGTVDARMQQRAKAIHQSQKINRFGGRIKEADPSSPYVVNSQPVIPNVALTNNPARQPDMFAAAIERATSHQMPPLTKKELRKVHGKKLVSPKIIGYGTGFLLFLGIMGYVGYTNLSNVMVKVASMRAGFTASMPGYKPAGFALSSVGYQPGLVSFNYKDNTHVYSVTERASTWDSATLENTLIIPEYGNNFRALMVNGQTIYVYGNDQAAWVSNNILYQVRGNGDLSQDQITQLATKL